MTPDYLDFDPQIASRLFDTSVVDRSRYSNNPGARDPRSPLPSYGNPFGDRREPGVTYLPSRTMTGMDGNLQTSIRFPSLADGNGYFEADMAVRRQLDTMKRTIQASRDPYSAGLMIDDMEHLKNGYRGLKAAGWDPSEASQAALSVGSAFGSNADFANRAEYLRMLADQRGTTVGAVSKQLGEQRRAFSQQYVTDIGFVGGLQPSALDVADADDAFADAFSAIRAVEDKYDYVFDQSTVSGILKEVSRTSAGLAKRGMSASEYGMDKVVEAAMYKVGALSGGDYASSPIAALDAADEADRRGITWSDFEWDRPDSQMQPGQPDYQQMKGLQAHDQDFALSRGLRDAFAEHRVRNLRSGRDVNDFSDVEPLRQGLVDALKTNSMTTKGLTDEDFGQLADAIIDKRSRGENVSVTDTLKDMLFSSSPNGLTSSERRGFSHNVSGKWGESYSQYLAKLSSADFDPKVVTAELRENVSQMLKTSGMTQEAQDAIFRMTEAYAQHYRRDSKEGGSKAATYRGQQDTDPEKSSPQLMKHRLTQLAQAAQLVSLIDVCRQAKVITDQDAKDLVSRFYDEKDPLNINLGVLHTVEAGAFHNAKHDTLRTWLLETSRNGRFDGGRIEVDPVKTGSTIAAVGTSDSPGAVLGAVAGAGTVAKEGGEGKPSNWRFASETRVREVGADPLEYTFRFLKDRLDRNDTVGISDTRELVGRTVKAMDALRAVYDGIEKDSNGNLKNSHVLTGDPDTARLYRREDVSIGWRGFIPFWKKDNRHEFDRAMRNFDYAMEDLTTVGGGAVVPGMDERGYDDTFSKTRLVGRWDNAAEATIDSGKSLDTGRLRAYVDPKKAEAWAEWASNQTMSSPNGRETVERIAQGLVKSQMAKFPGVSENDPRYRQALLNAYRFVKGKMVQGKTVMGIDDVVGEGDELIERAALMNTRPNTDRSGHRAYGGDFQLMQEMQTILAPLQEASDREFTQARQAELQQQAILQAAMDADHPAGSDNGEIVKPSGTSDLPPETLEKINRREQELGRPLTQTEYDAIVNG